LASPGPAHAPTGDHAVLPFGSMGEAVDIANDSIFALAAGI
jgi:hypothetical protein